MKQSLVIAAVVSGLLAFAVWRGCRDTSGEDLSDVPSMRPTRSSENTGAWRAKDPETPEEYAVLVRKKSIEAAKRNNAPIAFYGRVIDQDGKPLQGVAVGYTTTTIPAIPVPWGPINKESGSCVTDQNGVFSIEGKHGVSFGVNSLRKSGYRESGFYKQGHVRYEPSDPQRHIPVRDKPVEFTLIRDDLPVAVNVCEKRIRFAWDKAPVTVNLGPDLGDLILTTKRSGFDPRNRNKSFDWSVEMRFDAFGVVPLKEESSRLAPSGGYSPGYIHDFPKDRSGWKSRVEGSRFAIMTSNRIFGEMTTDIYADGSDDASSFWITIYLNKSGARNLDHR